MCNKATCTDPGSPRDGAKYQRQRVVPDIPPQDDQGDMSVPDALVQGTQHNTAANTMRKHEGAP
jgi:hypothetical protein